MITPPAVFADAVSRSAQLRALQDAGEQEFDGPLHFPARIGGERFSVEAASLISPSEGAYQLQTGEYPFANLPEAWAGRWGEGLTVAKIKNCRWLRPVLVGQFEFVEWTPDKHLRHSRFVGLKEEKKHL
jgi:hypothetical protein